MSLYLWRSNHHRNSSRTRAAARRATGYSAPAATIKVCGLAFCTAGNPRVVPTVGSGPVGVSVKYFG
jgi:hypothetical protein